MGTIALSRNARNLFAHLLAGGSTSDQRGLPELERAGLVEEGRVTAEGESRRGEFVPVGDRPSPAAIALLRRLVAGENVAVNDSTRSAYRQLAAWGLMTAGHSFVGGDESVYRFTVQGWARRLEFIAPSLSESA